MSEPHPDINDTSVYVMYRYTPAIAPAIIFVIIFLVTTVFHTYQLLRNRVWYFIPLTIGGAFEFVGYIGRIQSHYDQWAVGPFVQQTLLLLVAPALFAASIYMILGRIILLTDGEDCSMIRQRWLTKIFVMGDVLSFFLQGGGGGIQGSGDEKSLKLGEKLIVVGLFVQLAFFGFFVYVSFNFHRRITALKRISSINLDALPWKRHLYTLYATSGLILVRSLFRVIEYLQGNAGYLLRHEVFLYIFDAVLMTAVMVLFNYYHPNEVTDLYKQRISQRIESGMELRHEGA